ncbi:MAG TPA: APC family permease [Rhodanobacteraceae bacterium]|nr:APC family permease [Rhodanobacteraceae bacterium]
MNALDVLLGRRLANAESQQRRIGALEGVPAIGLGALTSVAYGPEVMLAILIPLGLAGPPLAPRLMLPIIALLLLLYASYWQTIRAYPGNGGAYAVARANLGSHAGLVAATALMIDYVLNVAVGISAGVAALVSVAPALQPYILPLCLGILALLTLLNLRGTAFSGRVLALPTYAFIACLSAIVALGAWHAWHAGGHPGPVIPPAALKTSVQAGGLWLLVRAFAAGCTAMTGVEAVSNSLSAFRDPQVHYGQRTLTVIIVVLTLLLAGVAWLIPAYRIGAMEQTQSGYRSVLAQLIGAVVGDGAFYFVAMASLLCVLTLSANTSFMAFPRLCRDVAEDGYLPEGFAQAGRRLTYSLGMLFLAVSAGLLLLVFGGITDRLIPLFAIGAFLGFTSSQLAMVEHWRRTLREVRGARALMQRVHLGMNAIGALASAMVLMVILVSKFLEGAWIVVIAAPVVIFVLMRIHRYYAEVRQRTAEFETLDVQDSRAPTALVVIERWDKPALKALEFGLGISGCVIALHLTRLRGPETDEHLQELQRRWHEQVEAPALARHRHAPELRVLEASYRTLHQPVLSLIQELEGAAPDGRFAVLIPELVKQHWWQQPLHAHRARSLRRNLLKCGDPRLTVISVPWYLEPKPR